MATILIVDDRPVNRQFLATLLGYTGHKIVEAADGVEALEVVRRERPDLAIVDIVMPNMDGIEFVRELRRIEAEEDPAVIFYTASYRASEAHRIAATVGVEHVLQKPARPEEILDIVCKLLRDDANPALKVLHMADGPGREASTPVAITQPLLRSEYLNTRMAALIELNYEMTAVSDAELLLRLACGGARRIIDADLAAIGTVDQADRQLTHYVVSTASDVARSETQPVDPCAGVLGELLESGAPCRYNSAGSVTRPLLPEHGDYHAFLGVPLRTPVQSHGWMYFVKASEGAGFSLDDERLGATIASHVTVIFENVLLVQQLKTTTEELRCSNENLLRYTSTVSHDIRSPLRTLSMLSTMVERSAGDGLGAVPRDYLATMRKRIARMQRMVDDLLEYARIGERRLHRETVDVGVLLDDIISMYSAPDSFTIVTPDNAPVLTTYRAPLDLVLRNLVGNAVKHRKRNDGCIDVTVRDSDGYTEFAVVDDGPGIAPRYHDQIFREFETLDSKDATDSNGLGLAMVKKTVEVFGGEVGVDSREGEGARFWFTWPKAANES